MGDTPGVSEPTLEEQIAAYQREFQDLDPQVEKIVSALSRLNRRMNVAYGRQTAELQFTCKVNARGQVSELKIDRNRVGYRGY